MLPGTSWIISMTGKNKDWCQVVAKWALLMSVYITRSKLSNRTHTLSAFPAESYTGTMDKLLLVMKWSLN